MNLKRGILICCVSFFMSPTFADMSLAEASMPSPPIMTVTTPELVTYFKSVQKKRKLTLSESEILQLVSVGSEVFKIETYVVTGHHSETEKEKSVSALMIAKTIEAKLKQKPSWDESIPVVDREKIKLIEESIKTTLGGDAYGIAWLLYQNGKKEEAKSILNRGFDRAFEKGMKVEYIGFSDENPIHDAEEFAKALSFISTESEIKAQSERLRKLRVHASNLPQIMT